MMRHATLLTIRASSAPAVVAAPAGEDVDADRVLLMVSPMWLPVATFYDVMKPILAPQPREQ
jgi:hypothetical protein